MTDRVDLESKFTEFAAIDAALTALQQGAQAEATVAEQMREQRHTLSAQVTRLAAQVPAWTTAKANEMRQVEREWEASRAAHAERVGTREAELAGLEQRIQQRQAEVATLEGQVGRLQQKLATSRDKAVQALAAELQSA